MSHEARTFLTALFGSKPEGLFVLVWTLHDKSSSWFRSLEEAVKYIEAVSGRDVYVGVGLSPCDYGPTHRCVSNEVAGIVGLWADFDLKSEAHKKALPATTEQALTIIPSDFPPTIVVFSGNGVHAWWLFKEPWIFENEAERKKASILISRFHTLLQYDSSQQGWAFDRLKDLARVLRIPGTVNTKDPNTPKDVRIHSSNERRYNPSDFENYLDNVGISDLDADDHAAMGWRERVADQQLAINLDAAIPDDLLARWMETDMRFRNTWKRQRHDLNDPSQSGYDLALACFGVAAGLNEQRIVDLIVHHRRLHREPPRTREDYFRRTISKAMRRTGGPGLIIPGTTAPNSAGAMPVSADAPAQKDPPGPKTEADELYEKARLCQQISTQLEIPILRIRKITGKEPVYQLDLEDGCCIEFPNVAKLLSQKFVSLAFAGEVGKIIPNFRPQQWRQLSQMMLNACTIEHGTDDLGFKGAARIYIAQYLAENAFITSLEGQTGSSQRKPMVVDGKITISATDLQIFINKENFQNHSVKAIASMVAALGAKAVRVRGLTFKEQSRWALPIEEFDPKGYPDHDREDRGNAE